MTSHDNVTDIVERLVAEKYESDEHGIWAIPRNPEGREAAQVIATLRKQLEKSDAMQDLAYYNGAKQYAVMAGESEEAAQEWLLGGCGNRQQDAIRALKGQPVNKPSGIAVDSPTSIQHDKSGYTP